MNLIKNCGVLLNMFQQLFDSLCAWEFKEYNIQEPIEVEKKRKKERWGKRTIKRTVGWNPGNEVL